MPIEIRPVTVEDVEGLLTGRRRPAAPSRPTTRLAPGGEVDFAAAVDGPWPVADSDEFAVQLARAARYLATVRHAGVDCRPEDLTPLEAFVHGVAAAAAWSVGLAERAPLGRDRLQVSNRAAAAQRDWPGTSRSGRRTGRAPTTPPACSRGCPG
jgi:hypothetical protein